MLRMKRRAESLTVWTEAAKIICWDRYFLFLSRNNFFIDLIINDSRVGIPEKYVMLLTGFKIFWNFLFNFLDEFNLSIFIFKSQGFIVWFLKKYLNHLHCIRSNRRSTFQMMTQAPFISSLVGKYFIPQNKTSLLEPGKVYDLLAANGLRFCLQNIINCKLLKK